MKRYQWLSQFHYGSIKTYLNEIMDININMSQFHYGSIKTSNFGKMSDNEKKVSIPLWFD